MKIKSSLLGFAVAMSGLAALAGYRAANPCPNCPISMALGACGVGQTCETATKTEMAGGAALMNASFDEPAQPKENKPQENPAVSPEKKDQPAPAQDGQAQPSNDKNKSPETGKQPGNQDATKPGDKPAEKANVKTETAMFGAGCFWGVEATFRKQAGVVDTAVGYAGGKMKNPTYKDVCTDTTGHAEVVKIDFDPTKVSYEQLVQLFFKLHDPTQVNRQGPDFGSQYRTAIFFYSPAQEATARAVKDKLEKSGKYKKPIATQIEKAGEFYRAEEYHQRYLEKRNLDNCHLPPADE